MSKIIGIDLGPTNSCVAVSEAVYPAHHPLFRCSVAGAVGLSCRDCRSRAGGCGAGSI